MGYLGGLHYWWPKDVMANVSQRLGRFASYCGLVGLNLRSSPSIILGYMGMPRRYHAYAERISGLNVSRQPVRKFSERVCDTSDLFRLWSMRYDAGRLQILRNLPGLEWGRLPTSKLRISYDTCCTWELMNLPAREVQVVGVSE